MIITDATMFVIMGWLIILTLSIVAIQHSQVKDFNVLSKEITTLYNRLYFYDDLWTAAIDTATPEELRKLERIHDKASSCHKKKEE